jgi:fatty acid desaturase
MPQRSISAYAGEIRPLLPASVFAPAHSRLLWLPVHLLVIAGLVSAIALDWVAVAWQVPLSLVLGASFAGLTFLGHETLHGAVVRHRLLRRVVGFIGFLPFCISPRLWVAWHNRVHHGHTNHAGIDPDAYPTLAEYEASATVRAITDYGAPGRGRLRGALALLVGFTIQSTHMLFAARRTGMLSAKEHRKAVVETLLGVVLWASLGLLVGGTSFVLVYLLPLVVANAIVMALILTNHSLSPHTDVNDPLANSLSVTGPRFIEWLTLHFGFHV